MCCKGGYIQTDQTKWPLMLSLLVLNQMTLQQELLTRAHKCMCVCARVCKSIHRWSLVSVGTLMCPGTWTAQGITRHSSPSSRILETAAGDQVTRD